MLAALFDGRREPEHVGFVKALSRHNRNELRLAHGQCAGLVDHQSVDFLHQLKRFSILHENAGARASTGADHDRHRRGKAKRTGASDDQHRDGIDQRMSQSRLGAGEVPDNERRHGDQHDGGHEPAGNLVGQCLDRRARSLCIRNHADDLRQHRVAANAVGAHHQRSGAIDRRTRDSLPRHFFNRHRLARDHRLIDRAAALHDEPVDRHLLARPDAQQVADVDMLEGDVLLDTIFDAARGLWRKAEQRPDRCAGRGAGAELQHLTQEDQRRDHGRGLEIDRDKPSHGPKRFREELRRERGNDAVAVGYSDAEADQREHVEVTRLQGRPEALEERPAAPQHDRSGQRQLQKHRQGRGQ